MAGTDFLFLKKLFHCLKMLSGQHFCWSHQDCLITIFCSHDHCQESQDRFSTSHISLHQPGHQRPSAQIPFNFVPDIHLCFRQIVGQIFNDLFRSPYRAHGKSIRRFFCLLFQHLDSQDKQQKLIKHQSSSCSKQLLHIFREMYGRQGEITVCQVVSFFIFICQIFRPEFLFFQNLVQKFYDGLIGKTGCEGIDGLKTVKDFLISPMSKNFRMLHLKSALFPCDPSSEHKGAAFFQYRFQIRHIKPGNRKLSGKICCCDCDHLQISYMVYINPCDDRHRNSCHRSLFQSLDLHRFLIGIVGSGVIMNKIFYICNTDLRK